MSRMPVPSSEATRPKTMAQQNRAPVRWWNGGQSGDGQGEGPESGQRVQPDEDEGADAGGQQPRDQDQLEERSTDTRGFHQQEGAEDRGAEEGADGGEASGRGHDDGGSRRRVALGQLHR